MHPGVGAATRRASRSQLPLRTGAEIRPGLLQLLFPGSLTPPPPWRPSAQAVQTRGWGPLDGAPVAWSIQKAAGPGTHMHTAPIHYWHMQVALWTTISHAGCMMQVCVPEGWGSKGGSLSLVPYGNQGR